MTSTDEPGVVSETVGLDGAAGNRAAVKQMKRRARNRRNSEDDAARCPLCGCSFDLDEGVGLPGQLAEGETTDGLDELVTIDLSGMAVRAIVAGADAPLRDEGFQVLFVVCSRECEAAIRMGAGLDIMDRTGELPDPFAQGVGGLRVLNPAAGITEARLARMDRFDQFLRDHAPDVARRLGADRLPPTSIDELTDDEIAAANRQLLQRCGWCLREIADDVAVEAAFITLDLDEGGDRPGIVRSLMIGDRIVAAQLVDPDSPAAERGNAVILLCSAECVRQFAEQSSR